MGLWDTIKRGAIGVSTGGLSEVGKWAVDNVSKGGVGDNIFGKVKTATPGDSSNYDYGGDPEYAKNLRSYLEQRKNDAVHRGAYQMDRTAATNAMVGFGGAMGREGAARADQMAAADMYRQAAEGKAPSVAAAQMRQGLEESSRLGQNMAANAAGANPLLASSNAAAASADAARRSTSAAAAMRAQEIDAARAGFAGVTGAIRGADQAAANNWLAGGQFGMGVEGQQAGLEMQQRQMNDAMQQAYENYQLQVNRDALSGRMGYGNAQTQVSLGNAGNSVQRRGQNQQMTEKIADGIYGGLAGGGMG